MVELNPAAKKIADSLINSITKFVKDALLSHDHRLTRHSEHIARLETRISKLERLGNHDQP